MWQDREAVSPAVAVFILQRYLAADHKMTINTCYTAHPTHLTPTPTRPRQPPPAHPNPQPQPTPNPTRPPNPQPHPGPNPDPRTPNQLFARLRINQEVLAGCRCAAERNGERLTVGIEDGGAGDRLAVRAIQAGRTVGIACDRKHFQIVAVEVMDEGPFLLQRFNADSVHRGLCLIEKVLKVAPRGVVVES